MSVRVSLLGTSQIVGWAATEDVAPCIAGIAYDAAGVVRVCDGTTAAGSLIVGASSASIGTSGVGVLALGNGTAPGSTPADETQLYAADISAANSALHVVSEGLVACVMVGGLTVRQKAGTPGTDELQITNDGTTSLLHSASGAISLTSVAGVNLTSTSADITLTTTTSGSIVAVPTTAFSVKDPGSADVLSLSHNGTRALVANADGQTHYSTQSTHAHIFYNQTAPTNSLCFIGQVDGASLDGVMVPSDGAIGFSSNTAVTGGNIDAMFSRDAAAAIQMGVDVNGAAVNQTFKAHDGITGTDVAGANLTVAGGRGTGAGAGGSLVLATTTTLGTGTTAQTLVTRITVSQGAVTTDAVTVTFADKLDLAFNTGTGTKIGTATTQKIGFFNATPVVQQAGNSDVLGSLVTLGLRAASSNPPLNLGTGALTAGDSALGAVTTTGKVTNYNAVATAGWGVPAVYAQGRAVDQTARSAALATYTVGAADGSFEVSGNVLVTASATHSFSLDVAYTDESNAARTLILPMAQLAGALVAGGLITNVTGTGPYQSVVLQIRAKAATAITIRPSNGTFTSVTYNAEGVIKQVA